MLHEIAGAQFALLLDVQRAWMHEMVEIRSRGRLRKIVKQLLDIQPGRRVPETTFICSHCKRPVSAVAPGARRRSHCPHCLWSLHTHEDATQAQCQGQMEPVGISTQPGGEWSLVHRCRQCAATQEHAIAVDDNAAALLTVAAKRPRSTAAATRTEWVSSTGASI